MRGAVRQHVFFEGICQYCVGLPLSMLVPIDWLYCIRSRLLVECRVRSCRAKSPIGSKPDWHLC